VHLEVDRVLLFAEATVRSWRRNRAMPRRAQPFGGSRDLCGRCRCTLLALCTSITLLPRTCDATHPLNMSMHPRSPTPACDTCRTRWQRLSAFVMPASELTCHRIAYPEQRAESTHPLLARLARRDAVTGIGRNNADIAPPLTCADMR